MESRSASPLPASLGVQVTLSVNGRSRESPWLKSGLQLSDALLISRPLGTGVLFAGTMTGATKAADLDAALKGMACSQHTLVDQLEPVRGDIHAAQTSPVSACLGTRRDAPEQHRAQDPAGRSCHPGSPALDLFERGISSTLAPPTGQRIRGGQGSAATAPFSSLLELLVDPQTCGPRPLAAAANRGTTHPERPMASDRQRKSRMTEISGLWFAAETRLLNP